MNFFFSIVTIPATIGAKVLNIGKNLAKNNFFPMLVKKSLDCTRYFFLNQKVSFVIQIIPTFDPNQYPTIFPRIIPQ
jgi:hypothetical protein